MYHVYSFLKSKDKGYIVVKKVKESLYCYYFHLFFYIIYETQREIVTNFQTIVNGSLLSTCKTIVHIYNYSFCRVRMKTP